VGDLRINVADRGGRKRREGGPGAGRHQGDGPVCWAHPMVAVGIVDDSRTVELADGNRVGRPDPIVTRHNDKTNLSREGHFVANRDTCQITQALGHGSVVAPSILKATALLH
jgi:hypothetical protein